MVIDETAYIKQEVSVFRNFWDKEPQVSTLEAMVEAIRSDERTRELTEGYRRQKLDVLKNESMLFAVPCIFEGGNAVQQLSDVRLGRAFRDLGFACKRTCQGRGYIVVCRTTDEIKARQRLFASGEEFEFEEEQDTPI